MCLYMYNDYSYASQNQCTVQATESLIHMIIILMLLLDNVALNILLLIVALHGDGCL